MNRLITTVICSPVGINSMLAVDPSRPKIVVGIMVDQLRTDYIESLQNLFGEKGFKKLMREGHSSKTWISRSEALISSLRNGHGLHRELSARERGSFLHGLRPFETDYGGGSQRPLYNRKFHDGDVLSRLTCGFPPSATKLPSTVRGLQQSTPSPRSPAGHYHGRTCGQLRVTD